MPAPRRGANPSHNTSRGTANNDIAIDNNDPTWNTSLAKLPPYLAALKRNDLLFNQVKDSLSLVTRGYVVDSKHKKIVASWRHLQHVITNPAEGFTFENPSDPARFVAEPTSEQAARAALGVVSAYTGTDPDRIKEATDNAREKEKELLSQYSVDPISLEDIDRSMPVARLSRLRLSNHSVQGSCSACADR